MSDSGLRGKKQLQKSLHISADDCTGCYQCVLACSDEHGYDFNPMKSVIQVFKFEDEGRYVPYTCTQCDEAWCQKACPTDAISVDANGAKVVSEALCVGCKVCTIACPFGTINYNADSGKVIKCDLCGGDPACAKACPTSAITFVNSDTAQFGKMRDWAGKTDAGTQQSN